MFVKITAERQKNKISNCIYDAGSNCKCRYQILPPLTIAKKLTKMKKTKDERRNIAFNILQKYHDIINKVGEKPSEYDEERILDAMIEYATQEQSEAVELLQELFDLQNGPPLETYRKQWELVMDKISIFLKEKGGEG